MIVYYIFYFWVLIGTHLVLKYMPYNIAAFVSSLIYHMNIHGELHNKNNYITVIIDTFGT